MERLRIKNFLIIEDADFEVGRFNLIIGSQASGKSIIAKILFFCKIALHDDFKGDILIYFEKIFPKYTWNNGFKIEYKGENSALELKYDGELKCSLNKTPNNFKTHTLFIPDNRSSFSFIFENYFSLSESGVELDIFTISFGAFYERAKKAYFSQRDKNGLIDKFINSVIKGEYDYDNGQDWIISNNKKIKLSDASSGQREALPMLLILGFLSFRNDRMRSIFIEEPEAHLFPVSQKHIIELLSLLYNKHNTDFVLTTHSPYIPTAINCAILAHDIISRRGKNAVKDVFNPDFAIKYEDVRAYTIENGHLKSILNDELRLISASVIDSVSDEFENVFSNLLAL